MISNFLLADDDPDDSDFFNEALQGIDPSIRFHHAVNGKDLIEKLHHDVLTPQVIFLDINMPEMNGWECLDNLKNRLELKNIPVIMYSTTSSATLGKKAVSKGALAFYQKPSSFLQLQAFLKLIVESSSLHLKEQLKQIQTANIHTVYIE